MLSKKDFQQKQLLVVTNEQLQHLSLRNENILIKHKKQIVNQMSCSKLLAVFVIGPCTFTTNIVNKLLSYNVMIVALGNNLKTQFTINTYLDGNYVLREKQYEGGDHEIVMTQALINNKIINQGLLLQQLRNKSCELKTDIQKLKELHDMVDGTKFTDSLRGFEGNAAKLYFGHYFSEVGWYKRMPRTRNDIINFLLDVGYSFLFNFVEANLRLYGFDVYKGFYHTLFFQRKSLACDLMEPFRCIIDKQIRKSYNLGQIKEKDFRFSKGEYHLSCEKRKPYMKLMLDAILEYKTEIFDYVKSYYRGVMSGSYEMPVFYIDKTKLCG